MKIGILTFHNTLNYGAQLQAYALQTVLSQMGKDVEVVDYRNNAISVRETPLKPSVTPLLKHPRGSLRKFAAYGDLKARAFKFSRFAEGLMRLGPRIIEVAEITERYQTLIVGSDQVWNPMCTGGDMLYFFDDDVFMNVHKVSYAASFGADSFPMEYAERCGEAIGRFDCISVREESGIRIVQELSGRTAELVLDPTLLIERDKWADLGRNQQTGHYVFAYMVGESKRTLAYAKREARRRGIGLVAIDCYRHGRASGDITFRNGASPEEFLGLIRDADLVVTSSFHGMALSLVLETDVRYCLNLSRGNRNSRLETLASLAGIEDYDVTNGGCGEPIDFRTVRKRLEAEREHSMSFLSRTVF